jgi:hypothetical protein
MRLLLALLLSLFPAVAAAGAWPRAPGETYTLASFGTGDDWSGLYVEHGLGRQFTLGLEIGGTTDWNDAAAAFDGEGRAMIFLRRAILVRDDRPWKASVEVGFGADLDVEMTRAEPLEHETRLRLGLHVGRGFEIRGLGGWGNASLRVETGREATRYGLGLVGGVRPHPRLTTSLGLFAEREENTSFTLAPNVGWAVGTRWELQFGARLKDDGARSLVLGIARTF